MGKQTNKYKSTIRHVINPSAQTNNPCGVRDLSIGSYEWSIQTYERLKLESRELAMIFYIQYESGCRISEILSVKYDNILRDGSIKIIGKKGSNDRVINCSKIAESMIFCRKIKQDPFYNFNRFFVHRKWVQYGIVFKSENSTKRSTTHALRQLKAESIRENQDSNELVSQTLGQKNSKNGRFYGKQSKQK